MQTLEYGNSCPLPTHDKILTTSISSLWLWEQIGIKPHSDKPLQYQFLQPTLEFIRMIFHSLSDEYWRLIGWTTSLKCAITKTKTQISKLKQHSRRRGVFSDQIAIHRLHEGDECLVFSFFCFSTFTASRCFVPPFHWQKVADGSCPAEETHTRTPTNTK